MAVQVLAPDQTLDATRALPRQRRAAGVAAVLGCLLAVEAFWHAEGWRGLALSLVGLGFGYALFQSTFGFAGSFRAALERGEFAGFRAQALALGLTSIVFFPLLAEGSFFGQPLNGFAAPIGISFVIGAVLFGIGMQIGGGCASGTPFALGGGNTRLLATLAFFVAGSAIGAAHLDFWRGLPAFPAVTTQDLIGWQPALLVHLAIFGLIMRIIPAPPAADRAGGLRDFVQNPWSLTTGAIALAGFNVLTLVIAGRPWGETSGFTLWGSKLALAMGFDATHWPYWRGDPSPLSQSVFDDITSLMDFGIIIGALLAAGLSRRFRVHAGGSSRAWIAACIGGCLMGYGARLSDGCNIGAYFSALASGSLSAWVWVAAAFVGSAAGLRLWPLFGLA